jgi:hypothetical protein
MAPPFTLPDGSKAPHAPRAWPFGTRGPTPTLPVPQAWPQRPAKGFPAGIPPALF